MKKCSTSLIKRECKPKPHWGCISHLSDWQKFKRLITYLLRPWESSCVGESHIYAAQAYWFRCKITPFPKKRIWQYLPNYKCPYILTQQSQFWECIWQIFLHIDKMLCSVQFSCSVVSNSLQPMDCSTPGFPVHHRLPETVQTHVHRVGDHSTISSSVFPFPSCLQSYPASESFPTSQFFALGSQSIGATATASVLPMNIRTDLL